MAELYLSDPTWLARNRGFACPPKRAALGGSMAKYASGFASGGRATFDSRRVLRLTSRVVHVRFTTRRRTMPPAASSGVRKATEVEA